MALERRCSECPTSLKGLAPQAKTCSVNCRGKRSRRLKRAAEVPEYAQAVSEFVRREAPEIAHRVTEKVLEPIVREALTEDVLRSLDRMVGLTTLMVDALEEDLRSDDATIRQRAYTLGMKYTVGHPAVLRPEEANHGQQLNVIFGLPRPEANVEGVRPVGNGSGEGVQGDDEPPALGDAVELVCCDSCGADKPATEFVAGSTRCQECFDKRAAEVKALYPDV